MERGLWIIRILFGCEKPGPNNVRLSGDSVTSSTSSPRRSRSEDGKTEGLGPEEELRLRCRRVRGAPGRPDHPLIQADR